MTRRPSMSRAGTDRTWPFMLMLTDVSMVGLASNGKLELKGLRFTANAKFRRIEMSIEDLAISSKDAFCRFNTGERCNIQIGTAGVVEILQRYYLVEKAHSHRRHPVVAILRCVCTGKLQDKIV